MSGVNMETTARISIFGAGGLIGKAISAQLKNSGYTNVIDCTHKVLELTDQNAVKNFFEINRPEYIFFCAVKTVTDFEDTARKTADELQNNLLMLCNVMEFAQKYEVTKGVFLGSAMLYPWNDLHNEPLTEDLLERPNLSEYKKSMEAAVLGKYVGLKLCQYYHEQYNCKFVYALPTHIYGGFKDRKNLYFLEKMVQSICNAKLKGENSLYLDVFGEGKALKQFLHVDDCADAIIKVMQSYEDYTAPINIATNQPESWSSIVKKICKIVDYNGEIKFNADRKENLANRICSTEKLNKIGWQQKISMEQGLKLLCAECMERE